MSSHSQIPGIRSGVCLLASLVTQTVKSLPAARDLCSILGSGRSPGGGHGYPLQPSWLESPMDRGAWRATVHGVTKNGTPLNDSHFLSFGGATIYPPITTKSKAVGIRDRESGVLGGLLTTTLVIQAPWVLLSHHSRTHRPSRITL